MFKGIVKHIILNISRKQTFTSSLLGKRLSPFSNEKDIFHCFQNRKVRMEHHELYLIVVCKKNRKSSNTTVLNYMHFAFSIETVLVPSFLLGILMFFNNISWKYALPPSHHPVKIPSTASNESEFNLIPCNNSDKF